MARHVLYGHADSGHSYKVKLALTLLGIDHEYRHVDLSTPREERRADWRAASRFGEVPVLEVDGRPIVQSDAILLHLARATGRLGWETDPDRLTEWLFWEANRIGFSLPNLRLHLKWGPRAEAIEDWLRSRMEADLDRLDEALAGRTFLMGETVSAADMACCGYLFYADQIALDLTRWPGVGAWLDRIRALPGWKHPYDLMV